MLPEGTYTISNAEFSNCTSLSDGNTGPVIASNDDSSLGSKWKIIPLSGNRYHIQNFQYQSLYAWFKPFSGQGEQVVGNSLKSEWIIRETLNNSGLYTISPADKEDLFWGLDNHQANTPVELKGGQNLKHNHWALSSAPRIVETIIEALHLKLEWMDTTNTKMEPIHARLIGDLKGSNIPRDASISFPKPLKLIWDRRILGTAVLKSTYGPGQTDAYSVNLDITPTEGEDTTVRDYVRTLLKEASLDVELSGDQVTVTAGGKSYKNVAACFRKIINNTGFCSFRNQVDVRSIRITGSDPQRVGSEASLNTICHIEIRNPTNISVRIEKFPVDVYYQKIKIANLEVPGFDLLDGSTSDGFKQDIPVEFKPDNPKADQCVDFISKYITTNENLPISLSMPRVVISLPLSTVTIPAFSVDCRVQGINKQFVKTGTGYISLVRAPLLKTIDFKFQLENPTDARLTITFIKAKVKKSSNRLLCTIEKNVELNIPAGQTVSSGKIRKAEIALSLYRMITFLGKTTLKLDVEVERAVVSIGPFTLADLNFNLKGIDGKLKWSLLF